MPSVNWAFGNNLTHGVIDLTLANLDLFSGYQIQAVYAQSLSRQRY